MWLLRADEKIYTKYEAFVFPTAFAWASCTVYVGTGVNYNYSYSL